MDYTKLSSCDLLRAVGPDAAKWAEAFRQHVEKNPAIATDEGTLVGWFSNAMAQWETAHA